MSVATECPARRYATPNLTSRTIINLDLGPIVTVPAGTGALKLQDWRLTDRGASQNYETCSA